MIRHFKCLSIAGSDCSAGAGIQADLKTFSALGCYGMTVITAVTAQNTCGVRSAYSLPITCIQEQLEAIFEDMRPDAIKLGMLFSEDIINCVFEFLKSHAEGIPMVLDPVMVAKSGDPLLQPGAMLALKEKLIPLATVMTPNLPEAYCLMGRGDNLEEPLAWDSSMKLPGMMPKDRVHLAQGLLKWGSGSVLLKGGHDEGETADDLFLDQAGESHVLTAPRIVSRNTHGTGCTLSAAIAGYLAQGLSLLDACASAKQYLHGAIEAARHQQLGGGCGPVDHFYSAIKKIDGTRFT